MFQILTHDILPVFAILALGYGLGWRGTFSRAEAAVVNRVSLTLLQPALIFPLVATVPIAEFDVRALALYGLCEAVGFGIAFLIARRMFRREAAEAWMLAMAVVFVNSLLYIWPISFLIYGEAAALPVTALVAWDASLVFGIFIIGAELIANPSAGLSSAGRRIATNPILLAIAAGAVLNISGLPLPAPLITAAEFAGAAAAPLTLFALGVILSQQSLRPSPVVAAISGLKLLAFPALVAAALGIGGVEGRWNDLFTLTAAGPSGAMAFALALLHGVRTDAVAPVIIWTSVLSLISLAWLA
ncbi:AEC family transporter [Salipiger bermudensis]|uniref:Putative malonate transporter, mdcF, AEC family protein n=1 Tax=Salipiger bermudensis (strain DSM 26914 / JCM 13377 / KCTC 12554 / HTCC2601) TaxID=314265 RepID=Q0FNY0_SALBH|nr:AEC family transporter [Salipiger bermudensis]EAU45923.1 Putative malonate transporter, mdcF, AEC family protein [Salipiger bermudensis HTCC2601]